MPVCTSAMPGWHGEDEVSYLKVAVAFVMLMNSRCLSALT